MIATVVVILQVISCYGFGAIGLRTLGVDEEALIGEKLVYAFALGMGFIGWFVFLIGIAGFLDGTSLVAVLGVGFFAALFIHPKITYVFEWSNRGIFAFLLVVLISVGILDFFEALTPPGDTDTLAYHFTLPKQFINAGRIEFVPRALEGATALLVQMTYVPVLKLGGEKALMLWVFISGWVAVYAVYVLARRHLSEEWSLALALVFATTPAVVFGAGSGQVEVRIIIFVIASVLAVTTSKSNGTSFILLAGLLAGFFAGSKFLGLIFATLVGLAVLFQRRRISDGLIFSLGVVLAGSQWYVWNIYHVGDPMFPMLFEWLGKSGTTFWSNEHQFQFRNVFLPDYKSVPSNLFWLIAFPFKAMLDGELAFESGRTGLGPAVWVLLAFSLYGLWKFRAQVRFSPLFTYILIAAGFYAIWFLAGLPQRIRFLLPVYPLLMIPVAVAAERVANSTGAMKPLVAAIAFVIIIQIGGQTIFSLKSISYAFSEETRQQFLMRTISGFGPVPWMNKHLSKNAKIFLLARHYLYYIEIPKFYAHPHLQAQVNILPDQTNPNLLLKQLNERKITHLLLPVYGDIPQSGVFKLTEKLVALNCLQPVKTFSLTTIRSRTLPSLVAPRGKIGIYQVKPDNCRIA